VQDLQVQRKRSRIGFRKSLPVQVRQGWFNLSFQYDTEFLASEMGKAKLGAQLGTFASGLLSRSRKLFFPYFGRTGASRRIKVAPRINAVPRPSSGNPSDAAL
jgi:hypothetical protein